MSYGDIIAKAKREAEEREAQAAVQRAEHAARKSREEAIAREFLTSVVLEELEKARVEMAAGGVAAEIGNGQTGGKLRHTLTVTPPKGGSSQTLKFHADTRFSPDQGGIAAAIKVSRNELADKSINMSRETVRTEIRAFLTDIVKF